MDNEGIKNEISAIVKEVEYAVKEIKLCDDCFDSFVLVTKEEIEYKLTLRNTGLQVVFVHALSDCESEVAVGEVYESIYSFLNKVSSSYRELFAKSLSKKLSLLTS